MARARKPCEFCEEEHYLEQESKIEIHHQLLVEVYPQNSHIAVFSFAQDDCSEMNELSMDIEMNYCPVCGRKLDCI